MIATIKSEFLKIITVRSTYIILGVALAAEILFAFYLTAWRATPEQLLSKSYLSSQTAEGLSSLILLASFVTVLLITHEYRYNTIAYTLTSNKSRTSVFLSKLIAISGFAIIFSLVFGFLSPALSLLAIKMHGLTLSPQDYDFWSLLWRLVLYGWCFMIFAAIISFIVRIQVGAFAALFLVPALVESLLGFLFKANAVYLPFSAISALVGANGDMLKRISYGQAAAVSLTYAVVGLVVAGILFLKRDAN